METILDYYAEIDSPEFKGITDDDVIGLIPRHDSNHPDFTAAASVETSYRYSRKTSQIKVV